jgi:hypothetical protein
MMKRLTIVFLAFLTVATLSGGTAYHNASSLFSGHGTLLNALMLAGSALLFGFAMLVLGRIVYLTAPKHPRGEVRS